MMSGPHSPARLTIVINLTDFDGCGRACRFAGVHTFVWGDCEHAPEPDAQVAQVYLLRSRTASDGLPSLWFESVPVTELDEVRKLQQELETLRHEVVTLRLEKRAAEWRLIDLSQREMAVIGVVDEWVPRAAEWVPLAAFITYIRAALKMGDD